MRALVCREYGPPGSLVIEEHDDPVPGKGQVLVDIEAAGINFPDVLVIAGKYQVKIPTPFVPGNEAAGVVSAVGTGVTQFAVGDKVIINTSCGAFAEKCVADVHGTAPLPEDLSFEQGAGFSVTYGTSYHALKQSANLQPDETVLVLGAAGGVGITAVEIAKAMGARVIAAASSEEKLEFAKSAGADELINYSKVPLKETVKELTSGNGADVVYDPVGGELADQAFRATAWHGRYLVIGFASGDIPRFPANIALLKEASIIGVWWGTWATKDPQLQIRNMLEVAQLVKEGVLIPRVTESYSLDDYIDAFKAITERRARGKVTLRMS
ncbi:MAG: NADPH:quinone oxidoreductase family protein [Gammaproteobacteria bacterium]|nr:NADPH:quinone oxidoreductase family protein [Gammaproteobacteria bacterium]MDH3372658.1 NADPH:quinone oxidoreductase family protein [Gammaproteobacteria bacterium]MDH3409501.1 NADPH:quinone oxidoreductase family protein [Gammaproteobacteria bacterium]MDH3551007.1 NADPH:quinone oxidoreductase family protein [Gammaproteobacteria bacterium]